jgi:hypothetical protein
LIGSAKLNGLDHPITPIEGIEELLYLLPWNNIADAEMQTKRRSLHMST